MPYITPEDRVDIADALESVIPSITSFGKANYAITKLLLDAFDPTCYADFNSIVGVLECAKLEFYRRAAASYEDEKLRENGDVY